VWVHRRRWLAWARVHRQPAASILAFLLQAGPTILLVSIAAFALSLTMRRWMAALVALLVGGVIYWGMYGQSRLPVMYVTMALGLLGWAVIFLWVRGLPRRRTSSDWDAMLTMLGGKQESWQTLDKTFSI
jgi:hypothetical protein